VNHEWQGKRGDHLAAFQVMWLNLKPFKYVSTILNFLSFHPLKGEFSNTQMLLVKYILLYAISKIGFWFKFSRRKSAGEERGDEFQPAGILYSIPGS
jgi:hypothetical protein